MKIVEQTPNRLRLRANNLNGIVRTALFGTPFLLTGLAVMLFFGRLTSLKCQRVEPTQGSCQLVNSGLLGSDETTIPLNQLQGAKVDVNQDSDGDTYRVVLLTDGGEVPFTWVWSSGTGGKQKNADRINAFISNPGEISLRVQQDDRWFAYPFGGLFALVGAGLVFGSLLNGEFIVSFTFDKALGLVRLKQQTLRRTKVTEWRLREINQVEVKEHTDSDGDKTYSLTLNLRSGEHIPVPLQSITSQEGNQKMAECIRQFLNLKA